MEEIGNQIQEIEELRENPIIAEIKIEKENLKQKIINKIGIFK